MAEKKEEGKKEGEGAFSPDGMAIECNPVFEDDLTDAFEETMKEHSPEYYKVLEKFKNVE